PCRAGRPGARSAGSSTSWFPARPDTRRGPACGGGEEWVWRNRRPGRYTRPRAGRCVAWKEDKKGGKVFNLDCGLGRGRRRLVRGGDPPGNGQLITEETQPRMNTDGHGLETKSSSLSVSIRVHPWLRTLSFGGPAQPSGSSAVTPRQCRSFRLGPVARTGKAGCAAPRAPTFASHLATTPLRTRALRARSCRLSGSVVGRVGEAVLVDGARAHGILAGSQILERGGPGDHAVAQGPGHRLAGFRTESEHLP